MVKKTSILVIFLAIFLGCDSENAGDCFQKSGEIIQEKLQLNNFSLITVFEGVKLVVKQGVEQQVILETGKNLRNDITVEVLNNRLTIRNENSCNLVRDFGLTTLYVTSPNISEIRSSTGFPIKSDGVLSYPDLTLFSESFGDIEAETTDGEFDLTVNNTSVNIVSNGIAFFKINGATQNLNITFAAGDSRLDAENLMADNVNLFHRGSNDMLVNPQQALNGSIVGTGNVISYNTPATVEVEELYKGRLLFKN